VIDFDEILNSKEKELKLDPIEIYKDLSKKSTIGEIRTSQKQILEKWFNESKTEKDVIVKAPTGEGKTLIALLMLQSSLNEGKGPALYLCPNNQLVKQTVYQANLFGINVVQSPKQLPSDFISSKAILVTSCSKLFNGLSRFGTNGTGNYSIQTVGSMVIDDAHKSLDYIKESFSIIIKRDSDTKITEEVYLSILKLFEESINNQDESAYNSLICGLDALVAIPYWDMFDKSHEVTNLLNKYAKEDFLKFSWPLIKDKIKYCNCYFSGTTLEITPRKIPIDMIKSFADCNRRIFLSATLSNDAFLIKDLKVSINAIKNPIESSKEEYSGERLILIPSLLSDDFKREDIIKNLQKFAEEKHEYGIFAIVPSKRLSKDWNYSKVLIGNNIIDDIAKISNEIKEGKHNKLRVLVNQYDGVDLPDEICRVLCLDSLPSYNLLCNRHYNIVAPSSKVNEKIMAQRIEQGIGRATRSVNDYSTVLIIGDNLAQFLINPDKQKHLSPEIIKQINIGEYFIQQIKKAHNNFEFKHILEIINYVNDRKSGWKAFYNKKIDEQKVEFIPDDMIEIFELEEEAENDYFHQNYKNAQDKAQQLINLFKNDNKTKGWYLQLKALYTYPEDQKESKKIQYSAFENNDLLFRPRQIYSDRKNSIDRKRAESILEIIHQSNKSEIMTRVDVDLKNVNFDVSFDEFEEAIDSLGKLLGFKTDRPDKYNVDGGIDNTWIINDGGGLGFAIECKNRVLETNLISKDSAGQFVVNISLFKEKNTTIKKQYYVFLHPNHKLDDGANIDFQFYVMKKSQLKKLKNNVIKLYQSISSKDPLQTTVEDILESLSLFNLTSNELVNEYFKLGK